METGIKKLAKKKKNDEDLKLACQQKFFSYDSFSSFSFLRNFLCFNWHGRIFFFSDAVGYNKAIFWTWYKNLRTQLFLTVSFSKKTAQSLGMYKPLLSL